MKKGFVILGAVGISSVVMVTSGFAAMASTSGYSVYKDAIKATRALDSVSASGGLSLIDNGASLINVTGTAKANLTNETQSGSATIDSNGKKQTIDFYRQNNQSIIKNSDSDVYYQEQGRAEKKNKNEKPESKQIPTEVENIIDSLVGNLQNSVTLDNKADGTKDVSVSLSNAQLPPVVNAVGSLLIKNALDGKELNQKQGEIPGFDLKPALPALTQNIIIEQVDLKATINAANFIQHQEASITVSGKDAKGVSHQVVLQLTADLNGFNGTTADTIDLTGKNVKVLEHKQGVKDDENQKN
ncbi:MAG: hypothetical protein JWM44_4070 [Bacilli bacterium]|nr:hypothetical protein [Bacilli bacterium]